MREKEVERMKRKGDKRRIEKQREERRKKE